MPSLAEPPFKKYQDWDDDTIISGEREYSLVLHGRTFTHFPPCASDIIRAIQGFESNVKVIKTQQGDAFVYAVESNDENTKTYKVVIGPIEIDVTIDVNKLTIVIEVYVTIPFVGKVQVAKAVGNLRDGVKLTIGYPPFVGGSLTVKLDGKDVVLEYSIDALGWNYHGKIVVFTLP
ncbi:hypothetical protein M404DRAFT_27236 [Pisolithus tinctorius Marx 270]|uniref:Uncharacterized protein n=1 Tax=Pisolithus tinctorius Marx 270 TaxID=870435 RepID=A0A0C3J2F2_PISTI|nr:hypothetical protein M404DRAFT_626815 [Pisolithus tinctorius Marx 270]KIO03264.1 hypothetical protein M404DRAFT_27236 [Pisolithus tinctorius Marx 270]